MANSFLKPEKIARTALGLLEREIVLPGLVWRDAAGDFTGSKNDTISLRVPARATATVKALRSGTITETSLNETKVDVTLDSHVYSAVAISDAELTLDIEDFGEQVLMPQVRAVAEQVETLLAAEMTGATYATNVTWSAADPFGAIVDARKALNDAHVPMSERFVVLGSDLEADFLKWQGMRDVSQSGSDSALRDARIGRVAGMDVYASTAIPANEGYVFHRTAYVLSMKAPSIPSGASFGSSQSYAGMALRWLRDYNFSTTSDRSLVDVFVGTNIVADGPDGGDADTNPDFVRAVKLTKQGDL